MENGARQTETTGGPGFIIETRAETTPEPTQTEATPATEQAVTETSAQPTQTEAPPVTEPAEPGISEDGWYDSKDEVALYIHTYGHLPDNYITKKQA